MRRETEFKFKDGRTKLSLDDYRAKVTPFKIKQKKGTPWAAKAANKWGIPYWNEAGEAVKNASDGEKYYVGSASPTSLKIVTMKKRLESNKSNIVNRDEAIKQQTVGDDTFPKKGPKGFEQHHIKKLTQYSPFFKGTSDAEAAELAKFAKDRGYDLGNKEINALLMEAQKHTEFHNFEREKHFTKHGLKKISGPHIPKDFAKSSMDDRKYAMLQFLKNEQPKLDKQIAKISGQMPQSQNIKDFGEKFVKGIKGSQRGLQILRNAPKVGKGLGFLIDAGGAIAGTNELASGQGNRLRMAVIGYFGGDN